LFSHCETVYYHWAITLYGGPAAAMRQWWLI